MLRRSRRHHGFHGSRPHPTAHQRHAGPSRRPSRSHASSRDRRIPARDHIWRKLAWRASSGTCTTWSSEWISRQNKQQVSPNIDASSRTKSQIKLGIGRISAFSCCLPCSSVTTIINKTGIINHLALEFQDLCRSLSSLYSGVSQVPMVSAISCAVRYLATASKSANVAFLCSSVP